MRIISTLTQMAKVIKEKSYIINEKGYATKTKQKHRRKNWKQYIQEFRKKKPAFNQNLRFQYCTEEDRQRLTRLAISKDSPDNNQYDFSGEEMRKAYLDQLDEIKQLRPDQVTEPWLDRFQEILGERDDKKPRYLNDNTVVMLDDRFFDDTCRKPTAQSEFFPPVPEDKHKELKAVLQSLRRGLAHLETARNAQQDKDEPPAKKHRPGNEQAFPDSTTQ